MIDSRSVLIAVGVDVFFYTYYMRKTVKECRKQDQYQVEYLFLSLISIIPTPHDF